MTPKYLWESVMHQGRIVFSQIMDYLPSRHFKACVNRYRGDHRIRTFTCLDQFYCMSFAQLTGRESLRDIETCLRAVGAKLYHAGMKAKVSRTTLAKANELRDSPSLGPILVLYKVDPLDHK